MNITKSLLVIFSVFDKYILIFSFVVVVFFVFICVVFSLEVLLFWLVELFTLLTVLFFSVLVFADDELLLGVLFSVELDEGVVFVFVVVLLLVSVGVLFCSVFTVLCVEDDCDDCDDSCGCGCGGVVVGWSL